MPPFDAGSSSEAKTSLIPEAAYLLLLQSRETELVLSPARQAVLAALRGLSVKEDMQAVGEVGLKTFAVQCLASPSPTC